VLVPAPLHEAQDCSSRRVCGASHASFAVKRVQIGVMYEGRALHPLFELSLVVGCNCTPVRAALQSLVFILVHPRLLLGSFQSPSRDLRLWLVAL
jgi:hypothetical protein